MLFYMHSKTHYLALELFPVYDMAGSRVVSLQDAGKHMLMNRKSIAPL